jgi:endonuclease/exonuclease/phosphatase family metal-dependent hydrolase
MSSLIRKLPLALPLAALACALGGCFRPEPTDAATAAPGDYLFCFWNTENFFDDKVDGENREPDKLFDTWFGEDPDVFQHKLVNLTTVLASMNRGRGPDILAIAEAESERAAQLLAESLSKAVKPAPPYKHVLFRDPKGGRHIATAVITRLPVVADRTRLHGRRLRILETHVDVNGHDLVVMATHWTSRVSDDEGEGRERYADLIYGRFKAMYKSNPQVCMLVCGDFNDNPDDRSVTDALRATGDLDAVRAGGGEPMLYNLFAKTWQENKDRPLKEKVGTHYYRGHPYIFDQIVVSPGLLGGGGWTCLVDTAQVYKQKFVDPRGHPLRFGAPRDRGERGVSDHFPVTVRLKVQGGG